MKIGESEFTMYQSKGYDLMHATGRLSLYKKKILSRASHKENIFILEEDRCKIKFQPFQKLTKKERAKSKRYDINKVEDALN